MKSERKVWIVYCYLSEWEELPVQGVFSSQEQAVQYIDDCLKDVPYELDKYGSEDPRNWFWTFNKTPYSYEQYSISDWILDKGLEPENEE